MMDTLAMLCRTLVTVKMAFKCVKEVVILVNNTYFCEKDA